MLRRPPRSTLFPTRRSSDLGLTAATYLARFRRRVLVADGGAPRACWIPLSHNMPGFPSGITGDAILRRMTEQRSEEHTSELQSQSNLVCRLLLEKKKKKT